MGVPRVTSYAWCTDPIRRELGGIVAALKHVQQALCSWSKENFSTSLKTNDLHTKLEEMKTNPQYSRSGLCRFTDNDVASMASHCLDEGRRPDQEILQEDWERTE